NYEWPLVVDLVRGGLKFRLQHVPPDHLPNDVDVVLHGHTHVPRHEKRGNVLFLNPGCVTRRNRGSPPSVAWLEITNEKFTWRLGPLRFTQLRAGWIRRTDFCYMRRHILIRRPAK